MPPTGVSGVTAVFVVMSLTGRPSGSNPHVSARSCSSFCSASTVANVVFREEVLALVEMAKSCATATSAVASSPVATMTSASENPASESLELKLLNLDLAKAIHRD